MTAQHNENTLEILLVEDSLVNVYFVQELLKRSSQNITPNLTKASTLAAARECLKNQQIDVILLDLGLPDSQGLDTFRAINSFVVNCPIIVLSVLQDEEIATKAVREGAQDYFIKGTFDGKLLIRAILYAVERQKRREGDLLYLTQHDLLTGLVNRTMLENSLNGAIINAKQQSCLAALLYIDLDNFKKINDSLEHVKGDFLLQEVAQRLREIIREIDTVARLGGDEFAIILPGIKNKKNIITIADKVLHEIAKPFVIDDKEIYLTASMGISIYPDDGNNVQKLLKNADIAMYHAKENDGNNYQFCIRSLEILTQKKIKLEGELHQALKNNEFMLHYQPIIDIKTEKIVSLEALIRWRHPQEGVLAPNDFISMLEESNLILLVGEWVIRTACQVAKSWEQLGLDSIAINVSVNQLNMDFIETVKKILKETNFNPASLVLEFTESTLMQNTENNIFILNALQKLGIHLSIDDFGTGYSSLSYLKNFKVDNLKIDRSFVSGIPDNPTSVAIVTAIIAMAHSLNMNVIAEGVEKKEQLDFLKEKNCDQYQGFYFSKPRPADELDELFYLIKSQGK